MKFKKSKNWPYLKEFERVSQALLLLQQGLEPKSVSQKQMQNGRDLLLPKRVA